MEKAKYHNHFVKINNIKKFEAKELFDYIYYSIYNQSDRDASEKLNNFN